MLRRFSCHKFNTSFKIYAPRFRLEPHFLRIKKGCANNAAVRYIRYLKSVIRTGIANKWIEDDPFVGKRYVRTKPKREKLTESELQRIIELDLSELPRLDLVRDTFVFCCFTGLAFADISTLKREHVVTDDKGEMWIRKAREKTDEMSVIPMLEIPRRLMEKYRSHPRVVEKDAVFARMVVDVRSLLDAMPSELKARVDGEFLTGIAERPNEILKCAMYLFLGYLDGATQFAQSCGGGSSDSSLPWGRKEDEDDRRFAYRCMMHAHKMLKPSQPKRGVSGRR